MKLYIDTSHREKIFVSLDDKIYQSEARKGASQKLLPLIKKALKTQKINFEDIDEIIVEIKGQSFTGLRVGVSVANTLGWLLHVPVNGQKKPVYPHY
jgi:tRNA A37 threonylcarbamoyladenosine modification protein TsaB